MSATVDAIQVGIKNRLATISGLHASATEPAVIQPPQAYPRLFQWSFDEDFDGGTTYLFDVWVLVSIAPDLNRAQTALDPYLSKAGSKSIKAAIEADDTLGGIANYARVTGGGNYGKTQTDPAYLAGSVRVEVSVP